MACPCPPALFIGAALLLSACAAPRIDVQSVEVRDSSAAATKYEVVLELTNSADGPMRLLQWNYTFTGGGETYTGVWESLSTLPPGSTTRHVIPVVLLASGADAASGPWTISGSVYFRSPTRLAEILYDIGLYRSRTGFQGQSGASPATETQPSPPAATAAALPTAETVGG